MTDGTNDEEHDYEVSEDHPDKVYERGSREDRLERGEHHEQHASGEREGWGSREHEAEHTHRRSGRRESESDYRHRSSRDGEQGEEPEYRRSRGRPPSRQRRRERRYEEEKVEKGSASIWAGGSTFEAVAGAGAVVLTILGLVEILPFTMLAIGTIAAGVGMMFGGASIAAKYWNALEAMDAEPSESTELGGGLSTEIIGGAAGAVLGVLALLNVADPGVLIPAAIISLGGALLFGASATNHMRDVTIRHTTASRSSQRFARESIGAAASAQVFVGIGAAVLGILALANIGPPLTLSLVGILALGSSLLISGAAIGGRAAQRLAT